jgi:RNA recognition motif-containing protein
VEFSSAERALEAVKKMNKFNLDGRELQVNMPHRQREQRRVQRLYRPKKKENPHQEELDQIKKKFGEAFQLER